MRQYLLIVLAILTGSFLSTILFFFSPTWSTPQLFGQEGTLQDLSTTGGGDVVLATAVNQGSSEALVFVYDKNNQALNCYVAHKTEGLKLRGIRILTWDFMVQEFPRAKKGSSTSVNAVKDLVKKP